MRHIDTNYKLIWFHTFLKSVIGINKKNATDHPVVISIAVGFLIIGQRILKITNKIKLI